jgi:hypothetical protein
MGDQRLPGERGVTVINRSGAPTHPQSLFEFERFASLIDQA